jgi:acetyltransferase-like isoleucine patch superfamily enzyme
VWIGFEATILPGVIIGEGAVIGARSVVTANVPAFTVVAGNPARILRLLHK